METLELRLLFVAGLMVIGGVALLVGSVLSRITDFARSQRMTVRRGLAPSMQTSPVRHRMVTGHPYRDSRSRW